MCDVNPQFNKSLRGTFRVAPDSTGAIELQLKTGPCIKGFQLEKWKFEGLTDTTPSIKVVIKNNKLRIYDIGSLGHNEILLQYPGTSTTTLASDSDYKEYYFSEPSLVQNIQIQLLDATTNLPLTYSFVTLWANFFVV